MKFVTFKGNDRGHAAVNLAGVRFPLERPVEVSDEVAKTCEGSDYEFSVTKDPPKGGKDAAAKPEETEPGGEAADPVTDPDENPSN